VLDPHDASANTSPQKSPEAEDKLISVIAVQYFWVLKKVHWSDCDAAGIAWFANYFRWFEDAEEELYVGVLGRTRQSLLDELAFGMPRVEASAKYRAPIKAGQTIRIGIASVLENPRRLRHEFEMRDASDALLATGFVRVACFDLAAFKPRDLPPQVVQLVNDLPRAARDQSALPWV
jgi:acyl-CoA thioesterase FadM